MKKISVIFCLSFLSFGCKKYLEVPEPRTQLSGESIFRSDNTAIAAQVAIYSQLEAEALTYYMPLLTGFSSDELRNHAFSIEYDELYFNSLTASNNIISYVWSQWYKIIYQANSMVEGLSRSAGITPAVRDQLKGEALFIRAFAYFNLTNLFGAVPFTTTTDYTVNASLHRTSVDSIYGRMRTDLEEAAELLTTGYRSGTNANTSERVRPNKWTAKALLARVHLFMNNWSNAELISSEVINSGMYQLKTNLTDVFLKNNSEAIWQIMAVSRGYNSYPGGLFIETTTPSTSSVSPLFIDSFRPDDLRFSSWIGSIFDGIDTYYFPYKYKVGPNAPSITEYTMVLRLAEQFLIRSESRAMQNEMAGAEEDLNKIRIRSGLQPVSGLPQSGLLDSLEVERKFELMFETGDRWFNLKRTNRASAVLGPIKSDWQALDQLYPIPLSEINLNSNLYQNPGY